MTNKKQAVILILLFCAAGEARASSSGVQNDTNSTLSIGPGVVVTTKPYTGMDATVYPIPLVDFTCGNFYISAATAGYRLAAEENWTFAAIGRWRFDGYDSDDSDNLAGMHNRHMTVDGGGELSYFGNWGEVKLSFVTDMLGQHDGQEMRLGYTKPFNFDRITISPSVGMIWQSSNLANYYYGVRSDEAIAGRPAYSVGDAVNWFAGIRTQYKLDDRWTLLCDITYEWLDREIKDSPIVSDGYVISIMAGAMYRF